MAGESAEELAHRQRAKAERLLRSAEMYELGAKGEQATGVILDALREEGWAVFHDVHWPGRPRANLDHVIVGPPGVFVIDSKNWSGRIDVRDQTFRRNGRRQDATVAAAGDAALAVAGLLSAPTGASARSVLCFVREQPLAGWCYDVMVCSTANLREMLLSRPAVLAPEEVRLAAIELDVGFRSAAGVSVAQPAAAPRVLVRPHPIVKPRQASSGHRSRRRKTSFSGQLVRLGLVAIIGLVGASQLPRLADLGDVIGHGIAKSLNQKAPYESCAGLHEDYPRGVGKARAVNNLRPSHRKPAVEPEVYRANVALDTDHDGLACERRK